MAKRGRHPRQGGRTTPKGTRPPARISAFRTDSEPDIVRSAREALREGPASLLLMASGFVELSTPRRHDAWQGDLGPEKTNLADLVGSFVDTEFKPLHALTAAMLPMIGDDLLRTRLHRHEGVVGVSRTISWLETVHQPILDGVIGVLDILGDGDNVLIGVHWSEGTEMTAIIYIDHNMGTLVKDAFVLPMALDDVAAQYDALNRQAGGTIEPMDPAGARKRIEEALLRYDITIPPVTNEQWPTCRPLVEWFMSLLPDGGTGFEYHDRSDADDEQLLERFMASPFASELRAPMDITREIADHLIWLAAGSYPGDPLRWSPVVVEIVLVDLGPRKIRIAKADLRHVPEVLAAFVRFAHAERSIPAERTSETLEAVASWTPDYLDIIDEPIPTPAQNAGRLARLAAGIIDEDDDDDDDDEVVELDKARLVDAYEAALIEELGGSKAVAGLDDVPLPDDPFDWNAVPASGRYFAADILERTDRACTELLDVEMRTVCRVYLAALLRADEHLFRRSQRTDIIAAGLVWASLKLQLGSPRLVQGFPRPGIKDIAALLGVKSGSVSSRAPSIEATLRNDSDVLRQPMLHSAIRRDYLTRLAGIAAYREQLASADS